MNHQIKTVIIDDGVNEKLYNTGELWLNLEITRELQIQPRVDYSPYEPSHGTTCGAIIKKYRPGTIIGSIKVLNDIGRGVRDQLVTALRWCADNGIKLVNLSLGTIDFRDSEAMRRVVNDAYRKGVIIVAACNNKNVYTHPASLANVIGVKADLKGELKEGQYRYNYYPLDGIEITACASHSLEKYDDASKVTSPCNSFAAPMITAAVHHFLQQNPNTALDDLKKELARNAVNAASEPYHANLRRRTDWVETASIFNIHCSGEFMNNIPYEFPIQNVIDIECSTKAEGVAKVQRHLQRNTALATESGAIVVHINHFTGPDEEAGLPELITTLDAVNKNLVYLDDDSLRPNDFRKFGGRKIMLFHPSVYPKVTGGEKAGIEVPVIAVYDFGGREFLNIISKLKKIFQENGYHAIGVADTCKGIAAGIEYLPEVRNSTVNIVPITLEHINRVYDPDIILLGINAANKETEFLKNLEAKYKLDLKIRIPDERNPGIPDSNTDIKRKIRLMAWDEKYQNETERILNLSHENYEGELYRHIIELFEADGSFQDEYPS